MEPSSCDVWATSVDLVSQVNWPLDAQWVWGTGCYWQRSTCLVSRIKCRLTLFYHLCLGWGSATGEDIVLNRALRTPSQFLQFQNSWRKSCLIKWVVTCPDPNTQRFCVLGQVICSALHEQLARLHEFFERINSHDWRRKWQPTLVFLPGEFHEHGGLQYMGSQGVGHDWVTNNIAD